MTPFRITPLPQAVVDEVRHSRRDPYGNDDYSRVERAIRFIEARRRDRPSLDEVAAEIGLSEFHFQRLFQRWAGVSPKRFLQLLTLQEAKRLMHRTRSLLETSLELGLSGPSRLHDLFLSLERMTPGEYRSGARGLTVRWGIEDTPLGPALFAALDRGLCGVAFLMEGDEASALAGLRERWQWATLEHNPGAIRPYAQMVRERMHAKPKRPLSIVLKGTPLQLRVWEALLRIPAGHVAAYGDIARLVGIPHGARAVGSAIASNPIAYLIPCHRVIQSTGVLGDYHCGSARKAALLGLERARADIG